jgi:hypothetical protein
MKRWIKNIVWWILDKVSEWISEDEPIEELDITEDFYHE